MFKTNIGWAMSLVLLSLSFQGEARRILATPADYTTFLKTLKPGDTLELAAGTYMKNLTLSDLAGTKDAPIVITGSGNNEKSIFQAQSCCNTVSLSRCSHLVIQYLYLEGNGEAVDAVKAEGTAGNYTHHITIQYLDIHGYGQSQPIVGISTKCPSWNWIIRKNRIIGAGTGLYLGNSAGDKPFVNGLIEYNYVSAPIGYCMEIKHQLDGVRDEFEGTRVTGKTIIRHNVFEKSTNASTGASARPSLLVGAFPTSGWGKDDYYEIYNNFFYNNPVEALFQGTGKLHLVNNIFINHFDPSGFRAVYLAPHNGVAPRDILVMHNTVWAKNSSGGIRLYNPDPTFRQICLGNAVFSSSGITGFSESIQNITAPFSDASSYVTAATQSVSLLNLRPLPGTLKGLVPDTSLFQVPVPARYDFDGNDFDWQFRGAYSGSDAVIQRSLVLDTLSDIGNQSTSGAMEQESFPDNHRSLAFYPNPAGDWLHWHAARLPENHQLFIYAMDGTYIMAVPYYLLQADISPLLPGMYLVKSASSAEFGRFIRGK